MKVWGWQGDRGGCGHYRIKWPFEELERSTDWELGHGTVVPPEWRNAEVDVVIGQRVCLPGPSRSWQRWAAQGMNLVFELDDNFWRVPEFSTKAFKFYQRRDVLANLEANIRAAKIVTVSTEHLAEEVRNRFGHPDVRVILNALPERFLEIKPKIRHHLGWGGSNTHEGDLLQVGRSLNRYLHRNMDVTVASIGARIPGSDKFPPGQYAHTSWIPDPEKFVQSISWRLGLAPLETHTFNRSKSDCKILELAALGIPALVSDFGPYKVVEHGVTGYRVKYVHEWDRYLNRLVRAEDHLQELGQAAKEWARTRTTRTTALQWKEVIEDAAA